MTEGGGEGWGGGGGGGSFSAVFLSTAVVFEQNAECVVCAVLFIDCSVDGTVGLFNKLQTQKKIPPQTSQNRSSYDG